MFLKDHVKVKKNQELYVCSGIYNDKVLSKIIPASCKKEAGIIFSEKFAISAQEILGPFCSLRKKILDTTKVLKFSDNKIYKAIYNDWLVNAFCLLEPADYAYLIFLKRIDNRKDIQAPKGTTIVPMHELRFIKDE